MISRRPNRALLGGGAVLVASCALACGPVLAADRVAAIAAAAAPLATPAAGTLPDLGPGTAVSRLAGGGTAIVAPVVGAPVAAVELWYRAPSTGFGAKPQPALSRLAAQAVAASKPLAGLALGDLVASIGGRLEITAYPDAVAVSAVVPSDAAVKVVGAMTRAYFAPVVTSPGFDAARAQVVQESLFSAFDAQTIVRDAIFGQLFATGPERYPAGGTSNEVASLSLDATRAYATRAFRASNAVLVVSGVVAPDVVTASASGRPDAAPAVEPLVNPTLAASPGPVTKSFVEPSGGLGWVGPPIADERAATALDFVADYLFRPEAGVVARAVEEKHPDAFVGGQFITLNDPGVMVVVYSGASSPTLIDQIRAGLTSMQVPLPPQIFANAVRAFRAHIESDLQTPRELADNFGWYTVEGAPQYAPGANGAGGSYFRAAEALTPESVAATVRTYLGAAPVTVALRPESTATPSASAATGTPVTPRVPLPVPSTSPGPSPSSGGAIVPAPGATR